MTLSHKFFFFKKKKMFEYVYVNEFVNFVYYLVFAYFVDMVDIA